MIDINELRGILTALIFVAFIGVCAWAWSRQAKPGFDEAAQLPLDEDTREENKS